MQQENLQPCCLNAKYSDSHVRGKPAHEVQNNKNKDSIQRCSSNDLYNLLTVCKLNDSHTTADSQIEHFCHMVWRDSSAIDLEKTETAFQFIYWLKPLR